jgi:hypothetical protein
VKEDIKKLEAVELAEAQKRGLDPGLQVPRLPTAQPAVIAYPGGFLLHTGLPNPGLNAGLKKYSAKWTRSDLPIIVHLMADRPEETQNMVRRLEEIENVMAVELGFAPLLADDILLLTLEMCLGEIPLVFSLPVEQILSLGPRLIQKGADAVSIAAPRGALTLTPNPSPEERGGFITGRLFGPSLFPQTLDTVKNAAKLGLPIIGAGGVWSKESADAMLIGRRAGGAGGCGIVGSRVCVVGAGLPLPYFGFNNITGILRVVLSLYAA